MKQISLSDLMRGFKQNKHGKWYISITINQPQPHQVTDTLVQKSSNES